MEKKPMVGNRYLRVVLNLIRGALIGIAEVIPGVSGGTVALITGVYTRIINSASEAVRAIALLASFSKNNLVEASARFRAISWPLLIPLLIGMLAAIFLAASVIEPLLVQYPSLSRALFAGLIAASLIVPIRLSGGRWGVKEYLLALIATLVAFLLTSIPKAADADPQWFVILISAAVAVCALVLPGVSGSYLLLAFGMYGPTLAAVNGRDFGYLGIFIVGAILGLALFVSLLQYLLENYRRLTLVVMTGLMVGSLRALWPWQSDSGQALTPTTGLIAEIGFALLGIVLVASLMLVQRAVAKRANSSS